MNIGLRIASSCVAGLFLALAVWLWIGLRHRRPLSRNISLGLFVGGFAAAIFAVAVEAWALGAVGYLSGGGASVTRASHWDAALTMVAFSAPLEEALKVALIWPLYLQRRLLSGAVGVSYAVFIATGFAAGEVCALGFSEQASFLLLLRGLFAAPAHVFSAGVWGFMLGGTKRDRYFAVVWLACTLLRGVYDHIVFDRGPAFLAIVVPMLATMAWGIFALLRDQDSVSSGRFTAYSLFEPASVGSVRSVLGSKGQPLKLHWIFIGAFVNLGVITSFLVAAVYFGHRLNLDFSLVDESGTGGVAPIALLGGALLGAFPVAAFLVARASGSSSVLEPAWAMAAGIVFVLAIFSVTEPSALVIAVGIAPVGFLLACAGALLGIRRR